MRILFTAPQIPHYPGSAVEAAQFCWLRELAKRHEVTVVTIVAPGQEHHVAALSFVHDVRPVPWPTTRRYRNLGDYGTGIRRYLRLGYHLMFQPPFEVTERAPLREAMQEEVERLSLEDYDLVQVAHLAFAQWKSLRAPSLARVLVVYDVLSALENRASHLERTRLGKIRRRLEAYKLERFERSVLNQYHKCIVLSDTDERAIRSICPTADTAVVPLGVDLEYFRNTQPLRVQPATVLYTGTMLWHPNEDAVLYFFHQIMPLIRQRVPDLKLLVVGRGPPDSLRQLHQWDQGILVTGAVDDVRPYMRQSSVFIAPIRLGSGIRVKILEALAMQKAVVSTAVGCEGLGLEDGRDLLIADSPQDFANAVVRLLTDERLRSTLGANGRALVEQRFNWAVLGMALDAVYEEAADKAQVVTRKR